MFSNSTRNRCPLCSLISSSVSNFKEFISGLVSSKYDCQSINLETNDKDNQRVAEINKAAPDCNCEKYRMSKYSPNVIGNDEVLARFVFSPMHLDRKGNIKPSIFSHVFNVGCSIQRDTIATSKELIDFAKDFLDGNNNRSWEGVLLAKCNDVREINRDNANSRAVCIYDTASENNPSHGEMAQSQYIINDADQVELRHNLFQAFGKGIAVNPCHYRDGAIWEQLPQHLKCSKTAK
jgi:hypothetical protein